MGKAIRPGLSPAAYIHANGLQFSYALIDTLAAKLIEHRARHHFIGSQQMQDGQALCSGAGVPCQEFKRALDYGQVIGERFGICSAIPAMIFSTFSAMPEYGLSLLFCLAMFTL